MKQSNLSMPGSMSKQSPRVKGDRHDPAIDVPEHGGDRHEQHPVSGGTNARGAVPQTPGDGSVQPGSSASAPLEPGDEAPPGTPGTGEDVCPQCQGRGRLGNGQVCEMCGGDGRVVRAIGGG